MSEDRKRSPALPFTGSARRRATGYVALAAMLTLGLVACGGGDDDSPGSSPSGTPTPTPSPSGSGTSTPTPTPSATPTRVTVNFNFTGDVSNWRAGFADYPLGQETTFQLDQGYNTLPAELGASAGNGYFVSGSNPNSDLFMYTFRLVEGLIPNSRYRISSTIRFATNAPANCADGRGENVIVKAGASNVGPGRGADNFTTNFDKGAANTTSGSQVIRLGTFAQSTPNGSCASPLYSFKDLAVTAANNLAATPVVTSNNAGQLWLIQGVDSSYTGTTKIWFASGTFVLDPA